MKLIITGATGYVAAEVIRQSLHRPEVTAVVALARKATPVPTNLGPGADASKLKSVIIKDYGEYPEDVKKELAGADACIWTVAITPSKSSAYSPEEVKRICQTSTIIGLRTIHEAAHKPFRFLYMSGVAAERDQTKTPSFRPEYTLMRGETENQVLAYAAEHKSEVEALIVKPGLITSNRILADWIVTPIISAVAGVPKIPLSVVATVMLDRVIHGSDTDTLMSNDMVRLHAEGAAQTTKA